MKKLSKEKDFYLDFQKDNEFKFIWFFYNYKKS